MPKFRLIGYYEDTGQVYDGTWEGDDEWGAVQNCKSTIYPVERGNLCLVAILDEAGRNVYEGDKASFITDWEND
jgi:hypothetical protein